MLLRHSLVGSDIAEHPVLLLIVSSHAATTNTSRCGLGVIFQQPASGKNVAIADQGSLLISAGGTRSDPAIYSATTSTMIITSNSLAGAGRPNRLTVIYGTP